VTKPTAEEFERASFLADYGADDETQHGNLCRCFLSIHQSNTEIMALYDAAKAEIESLRAEVEKLRGEQCVGVQVIFSFQNQRLPEVRQGRCHRSR
jgi:hypothetical protein